MLYCFNRTKSKHIQTRDWLPVTRVHTSLSYVFKYKQNCVYFSIYFYLSFSMAFLNLKTLCKIQNCIGKGFTLSFCCLLIFLRTGLCPGAWTETFQYAYKHQRFHDVCHMQEHMLTIQRLCVSCVAHYQATRTKRIERHRDIKTRMVLDTTPEC